MERRMKQILTRVQAASILEQADKRISDINIFTPISDKNKYIKMTNEELEALLIKKVISSDSFSAVVDF